MTLPTSRCVAARTMITPKRQHVSETEEEPMRISTLASCVSCACAAFAMFAGCNSAGSQLAPSGLRQQNAAGVLTTPIAGRSLPATRQQGRHKVQYIVKDLGTFGGPASVIFETEQMLINGGIVAGGADIPVYDPTCFDPSCYVDHAFLWKDDALHDLGVLGGSSNSSSTATWLSKTGQVVGYSENGVYDPYTGQQWRAILWSGGKMRDLGTLGGATSIAGDVNVSGQITGVSFNTTPDSYPPLIVPGATQTRAVLWRDGHHIYDMGTLGGPDSWSFFINDHGQATGFSYINYVRGSNGAPTVDPFFWDPKRRRMLDMGGFGGTFGYPTSLNNRGEVGGFSFGPGNAANYAFLWHDGKLTKLPTLGGTDNEPQWMNEAGAQVGWAFLADGVTSHAALWKKGTVTDLGTLSGDRCATGYSINSSNQIVGHSWAMLGSCHWPDPSITDWNAVLWQNGSIVDLNSLIARRSPLHLVVAVNIDDAGDIAGLGVPRGVHVRDVEAKGHAFVLIPCEGDRARAQECGEDAAGSTRTIPFHQPFSQPQFQGNRAPVTGLAAIRARIARRYHLRSFNGWNGQF
jgi:probable HAF family extracellular repeat protein